MEESVRRGILSNYILLRLQQREVPATGEAEASTELFLKKLHLDQYVWGGGGGAPPWVLLGYVTLIFTLTVLPPRVSGTRRARSSWQTRGSR